MSAHRTRTKKYVQAKYLYKESRHFDYEAARIRTTNIFSNSEIECRCLRES